MKEIVYNIIYTGEDGRGKLEEVFVSKCEKERDLYFTSMNKQSQLLSICSEKIVNLEEIADNLFTNLTSTQKLALRYVNWDKF